MGDHDVPDASDHLRGKHIALIITGGIAAYRTPGLARALRRHGASVTACLSSEASRYVTREALEWATGRPVIDRLTAAAEHLHGADPFDAYLVAPATYNTLNKMNAGFADSPATSLLSVALGRSERGKARVFAVPTMHGDMHNSILQDSLLQLSARGVVLIPPRDAYGKHNLPDSASIVAHVIAGLSRSPLMNRRILVTAGSIPTRIDGVRLLSNPFRGRLGIEVAKELYLRGAEVRLVLGKQSLAPPAYLPVDWVADYDEYLETVLRRLSQTSMETGIFSAAVADYAARFPVRGKIPSDAMDSIPVKPTLKVIDIVRERLPELNLVSFKLQLDISHEELVRICRARVAKGHLAVVGNRGEERGENGEHVAHLFFEGGDPIRCETKSGIATTLCRFLEGNVRL